MASASVLCPTKYLSVPLTTRLIKRIQTAIKDTIVAWERIRNGSTHGQKRGNGVVGDPGRVARMVL